MTRVRYHLSTKMRLYHQRIVPTLGRARIRMVPPHVALAVCRQAHRVDLVDLGENGGNRGIGRLRRDECAVHRTPSRERENVEGQCGARVIGRENEENGREFPQHCAFLKTALEKRRGLQKRDVSHQAARSGCNPMRGRVEPIYTYPATRAASVCFRKHYLWITPDSCMWGSAIAIARPMNRI